MLVSRRVFQLLLLYYYFQYCVAANRKENRRNLIDLLRYVQNASNGTFLLPPVIIFPTFILPIQDQGKTYNNTNIGILNQKPQEENFYSNAENYDDDEEHFRQSLNRGTTTKRTNIDLLKSRISVRQSNTGKNVTINQTNMNNTTEIGNTTIIDEITENTTEGTPSTVENGKYPTSSYNNSGIDSLLLAIEIPDQQLPLANDNWQNYSQSTNVNVQINNTISSPSDSSTEQSRSTNEGPYSAAQYNNAMIDQLSITTNSYTNEESPLPSPKSDRWRTFASMEKIPSATGFKPLAGLYYDGFLHKPLIMMPGFIPRKYYNLY